MGEGAGNLEGGYYSIRKVTARLPEGIAESNAKMSLICSTSILRYQEKGYLIGTSRMIFYN